MRILTWVVFVALLTHAHAQSLLEHAANRALDPSNVEHRTPDDVYRSVHLDCTVHIGQVAHKGWANPYEKGGSMMDVRRS